MLRVLKYKSLCNVGNAALSVPQKRTTMEKEEKTEERTGEDGLEEETEYSFEVGV